MLLLDDIKKEPTKVEKVERDGFTAHTKSQVDAELARMRNMSAEEAAAAAARAVAEADAIMAEAEAAVREAEAAEADAVAAQAFAEAAMLTLKNRSSAKLVIVLSTYTLCSTVFYFACFQLTFCCFCILTLHHLNGNKYIHFTLM